MSLAHDLKLGTRSLHQQAERSGVVGALLRGAATRAGYTLLMRNLLPAYRALETALVAYREGRGLAPLVCPELFRADALAGDLECLAGTRFEDTLPLLAEGADYARGICEAAERDPALLAAHAYTRYLGDLGGGPILERALARTLSIEPAALGFYRFPDVDSMTEARDRYRAALDGVTDDRGRRAAIVEEARRAFRHNIAVSRAVAEGPDDRQVANASRR